MTHTKIVLASGSPRRRQLMAELGLNCTVIIAGVDESPLRDESPLDMAERLARAKASAVAATLESADSPVVVLAADTVVALEDAILGKPEDEADATRMLRLLRVGRHQVHTAVCVWDLQSQRHSTRVNTTHVDMRPYSDAEVERYVQSGDPMDKAGAYAIQDAEFAPVLALDGCLSGVMGLPLGDVCELLAEFGVEPKFAVADVCERQADFICCQRAGRT